MKTAFVVYCSPAGTTRHVAEVMAAQLEAQRYTVHRLDLGVGANPTRFYEQLNGAGAGDCLFVGSPVYRELAVPPVTAFLDGLPRADGCAAVPFVTWGGAISGVALWQMGKRFDDKGYVLAGAAKVLAVHSMMWQSTDPVGQGHPDGTDDEQLRGLIVEVAARLSGSSEERLSLADLDYQPESLSAEFKKKLEQPWMIIPKTIDEGKCTQCAICTQVCPVGAVSLDPLPVFNDRCFDCFGCIRECPEAAIVPAVTIEKIAAMIRERVEKYNEQPPTQIFL